MTPEQRARIAEALLDAANDDRLNMKPEALMREAAEALQAALRCAHGHTTRRVGCVSCVLVFDRQTERGVDGGSADNPRLTTPANHQNERIKQLEVTVTTLQAALDGTEEEILAEARRFREVAATMESASAKHCHQRCAAVAEWCAIQLRRTR